MDKVTIKIPRSLYDKVRVIVEDSGFSSPTEFIVYVLRDLVSERMAQSEQRPEMDGKDSDKPAKELSSEEIAAIKKRLKNLGYL